ncbi:twin-arginine translocase TatA/TatE family subunit [Arthrobacter sp. NEB 688]|uniref:twin-arginine translocase TatA/TatE family subunit n=1 Tax=Arthrobacter sp. NEB 688 TaxID=904039 RepID=UPI00156441F4|nr:twin-arginine translocase TatA/TatE family subunit [Arthrobacter sp. NEB 688]
MFGVNGWEIILLALIAVFVLGPDKLPEYAAKLARGIRQLRVMAEGAKTSLRDQLGPEYEDIDWRQYDPRQYDPRRIVREALLEPLDEAVAPIRGEISTVRDAARVRRPGGDAATAAAAGAAGAGAAAAGAAATTTGASSGTAAAAPATDLGDGYVEDGYDDEYVTVQPWMTPQAFDPALPTPFDTDAT